MRVVHVINSLATGGAEKLLLDSIPIYNNKGITTDLLLLNDNHQIFLKQLEEKKCCSVFKLSNKSVYNPLLILKIIPFLRKYDIVHVHLFPALYWVALAKMISFSKTRLIYTEHNTNNRRRRLLLFKILDRIIYGKYDTVIAITNEVKDLLLHHLNNNYSNKMVVVNNGVDLDVITKAKPYSKNDFFDDDKALISIQVARFHPQKNQETLIKAIQLLPENFKLILVGDGDLLEESKKRVEATNLQHRILFLGNRNDVPQLLKTADFVVLSSNFEGLSLSCIEGLASGKPFIASDVPGLKEIVRHHGIVFENGNETKLAQIILDLSTNKVEYEAVANKCIQRSKDFSILKMIENYINLYKQNKKQRHAKT
jgi:glycosyltransferase involved in cell wall biosynthesis